ncbi:MAG: aldehyde ferredoxin oxidoreductase family protein, partial [bacterium]
MDHDYMILRVNLTDKELKSEPVKEGWGRKFIGGKGLGAAYLLKELPKGVKPLSPENKLMFFIGPLTGIAPGTSRYVVVTKSPLTSTFLDTYAGGHFPAELRFSLSEHLGIIFEGRAEEMVYLLIDRGKVEIKNGEHLRGKSTAAVKNAFKGFKVASIGLAGENLVRYACITNDFGRNAGRGGAGAVMGSKNLKAIVVRGDKDIDISEKVMELRRKHSKRLAGARWFREAGTTRIVDTCNDAGILPTENWTKGTFTKVEKINSNAVMKNIVSHSACYFCQVACNIHTKAKTGLFKGVYIDGPEYETIALGGSNTGVSDLSAISEFNRICDDLGMDTISTGAVIAWAMECSKKGIIDEKLAFGDGIALVGAVKMIARRKGIGNLLAEGVARASKKLGKE